MPKPIQHALIMAAGRGSRMRPLTDVVPKAMAPWKGGTLISAVINMVKHHCEHIHVTVGYKGSLLSSHVIDLGVHSIFNTNGRENSWWIYNTLLRYVNSPVLVLTCDNVAQLDFGHLADDYNRAGSPSCMLVPVRPIPDAQGDYIHSDCGRVTAVSRTLPSAIYCSGIQILNPCKIASLAPEASSFYDVWQALIQAKQIAVSSVFPENWLAVDTLDQIMVFDDASWPAQNQPA